MNHVRNLIEKLKNRPIAVLGLGVSGMAVVKAFLKSGADVYVWDDAEQPRLFAEQEGAQAEPFTREILRRCAFLVLAPGIPHSHETVRLAREIGLEVICDIEVFHRLNHGHKTVGITGTNGKSTTTALITHILNESGHPAIMGGNIGKAVFSLEIPDEQVTFVFELSSYQLELCPTYHPDIAVLLNISPDHLDRHDGMDGYVAAKASIFRGEGLAVIGEDDAWSLSVSEDQRNFRTRKITPISVSRELPFGVYAKDEVLYESTAGQSGEVLSLAGLPALKGQHNAQNIAAAWAVCRALDVKAKDFEKALHSFAGLPHRQFPVRNIGGVTYINDSKATNADSTRHALAAFEHIFWIVGGRAKSGGLEGLEEFAGKIEKAYLIGEAIPSFQRWMGRNDIIFNVANVLQVAVERAHKDAQAFAAKTGQGAVVLLSPACASFDQFKSYEKRGDRFAELVKKLKEPAPSRNKSRKEAS